MCSLRTLTSIGRNFLIVFVLLKECLAVRFVYLGVPGSILRGESVWLDCGYDLQDDELYSTKWYKDNFEFYRYLPSDKPPSQMLNLDGVYLDLLMSNATHVYLKTTDLDTEGTYACEVSTDAPSFRTVRAEKELRVYVLPKSDPVITGVLNRYPIGDELNVSCRFGPSKPVAALTWYINGMEASSTFVSEHHTYNHYEGLDTVESRLQFVLDPSHLWQGSLTLQCTASVPQVYSQSSEELILSDGTSGDEFQRRKYPITQVAPGQEGPSITGGRPRYEIDDMVDVNCTAARSVHPAKLQWHVNENEAKPEFLMSHKPVIYADGLVSTRLGLKFRVNDEHFKRDEMRLKCTATMSKVVEMTSVETIYGGNHRSSGLLHVADNSGTKLESTLIVCIYSLINNLLSTR